MAPTTSAEVWARWTYEGFHYWPDAPTSRAYLADRHRHLFHAEVRVTVEHDDRDIEFHDLLDVARTALNGVAAPYESCEMMARRAAEAVQARWPGRPVQVTVSEDNECGATLRWG